MPENPNIVLIMADQWQGDCLSAAGHPIVHTPYLDQLSHEGARFERAYAATPTCVPARASLYTGLKQESHGRIGYEDGVPWNYPTTIASEFGRHGYQTQAVGKLHAYPERSQMGFQHILLHDGYLHFPRKNYRDYGMFDDYLPWLREQLGYDADYFDHGVNANSHVARPWDKPEYTHPTNWVASQSINFLKRRDPRKPFFLFMSFHRPHPPYDPPEWSFDQYLDESLPNVPVGDWVEDFPEFATVPSAFSDPRRPDTFYGKVALSTLQRARSGYYGHMTHIDHQINRFLETLEEFGQRENSYICFLSDHGEMLGDHHLWRKGYPYEGSSRIPLILEGPEDSGIDRRTVVSDQVVELRDIMPTLLECADLPRPKSLEGRSLLSLAKGEKTGWREFLHGEQLLFGQSQQWITDGKDKYVWFSGNGREQLFDLKNDPQELHDLASQSDYRERLERWRHVLVRELSNREEGFTDGETLIPNRPVKTTLEHLF